MNIHGRISVDDLPEEVIEAYTRIIEFTESNIARIIECGPPQETGTDGKLSVLTSMMANAVLMTIKIGKFKVATEDVLLAVHEMMHHHAGICVSFNVTVDGEH